MKPSNIFGGNKEFIDFKRPLWYYSEKLKEYKEGKDDCQYYNHLRDLQETRDKIDIKDKTLIKDYNDLIKEFLRLKFRDCIK